MYIARILYPVEVLGPGKRVGIWFAGCPHRCKGCSNPELWEFSECYKTSVETVLSLIGKVVAENRIDGFTVTGGDPMHQPEELAELLSGLKKISSDIIVYTGYGIEELPEEYLGNISVLIDGKYIEERNNGCILRGSDNQRIHILDSSLSGKYKEYLSNEKNRIQNFTTPDGIISVGIHKAGFPDELDSRMSAKGLSSDE